MPQKSHAYAVGQVRVLEGSLIGKAQLERLCAAQSLDELAKALSEIGWGDAKSRKDIERLADEHMLAACRFVRENSPEPDATDAFLVQYDVLNLKLLFKGRMLGERDFALSPCGTIDPERLRRYVEESNYRDLPEELRVTMDAIERRCAVGMDPLFVDSELDKAMYAYIFRRLKRARDPELLLYFQAKVECTNLVTALRVNRMGRTVAFAQTQMMPGGTIDIEACAKVAGEPDRAYDLIRLRPYRDALAASVKSGAVAQIERAADDYLTSLLRPGKYLPTSVLPLIGYLVAREREAGAIRLITTAKSARVPEEKLLERLRALY